jgi:hypothetical protein
MSGPSVLFKFRDDSERTEQILTNKQVWLSCPDQLNDPLECKPGTIPSDWEAATIRKMEEMQILGVLVGLPGQPLPVTLFSLTERQTRKWRERFRRLSHQRKVNAMRKLYSDHGIEVSHPEAIFENMRERLSRVGIFSLSESNDNELMWSHYGGSHTGLALGFKRSHGSKLASFRHTVRVVYADQKPQFTAGFKNEVSFRATVDGRLESVSRVSFEDDVFRTSLSTKTLAWSYEREWRYVEEEHGLFNLPGSIESIVFGLRMPVQRREVYQRLAREFVGGEVDFYEVKQSPQANGFFVEKIHA